MKRKIKMLFLGMGIFITAACTGCGSGQAGGILGAGGKGGNTLRILSGSENQELEEIINACAKETGISIEMDYKGSVDIMEELKGGAPDYDGVWPASSMWISMGDEQHLVKHAESVYMTPVVFGIRESLAMELGFTDTDVSVRDILASIEKKEMSFCMTSATQSNSGASAYMGFLYALMGKQEGMTAEDLDDPALQENIKELLGGVERSSGSSDWLKELFLNGNYDAMVNYECLIIDANQQLEEEGKEPLYVIYPYDGLSIADSPLGYVDHKDEKKEEAFLKVQEYLLSDEVQKEIEATGRRIRVNQIEEENKDAALDCWGIDTEKILSPIQMPDGEVLLKALNVYQTTLRKPSFTVYCLDFSGSMSGEGEEQLKEAMSQILIQENAAKNLLQASEGEVNTVIFFDDTILGVETARDDSDEALAELNKKVEDFSIGGGTDIYIAAAKALEIASQYDLENYTPAVILMTDGQSTENFQVFQDAWDVFGEDVPVFSITFGDADPTQLEELAQLTGGRVFDGTEDLTEAFRSVKGYN